MRVFRHMALVVLVIIIGAGGFVGWRWLMDVPVRQTQIRGLVNTPAEAVTELMDVDTTRTLYALERRILEDRIRRYPWIAEASVRRIPTGLLAVDVLERAPVARALTADGRPGIYLDRAGARMPAVDSLFYDVPLISGYTEPYHPVRPVQHASLRELLDVLPTLEPKTDALISELELTGEGVVLHTSPAGNHGSIPVAMGHDGYDEKFMRLQAFWDEQVLRHQDVRYTHIDLRFEGQIVTREH